LIHPREERGNYGVRRVSLTLKRRLQMPSSIQNMLNSQGFWEVAFIVALVLIIGAHKITIEGLVST
jgi:hypothetical protein